VATTGNVEIFDLLVKNGFKITDLTKDFAVGNPKIMEYLMKNGYLSNEKTTKYLQRKKDADELRNISYGIQTINNGKLYGLCQVDYSNVAYNLFLNKNPTL